jgi:hypothetical protein
MFRRCQQSSNALDQGQVSEIDQTRRRAWASSFAGTGGPQTAEHAGPSGGDSPWGTGRRPEEVVAQRLECPAQDSDVAPVLVDNLKANRFGRRLPIPPRPPRHFTPSRAAALTTDRDPAPETAPPPAAGSTITRASLQADIASRPARGPRTQLRANVSRPASASHWPRRVGRRSASRWSRRACRIPWRPGRGPGPTG